jgi:hypothetical protein
MSRPEIIVESWQEFIQVAEQLNVGSIAQPEYVYRGQPRPEWSLMPTLPREAAEVGLNAAQTLEIESVALDLFKKQAHLWLDSNTWTATTQILEWWTLMQHHSAPTRMLDWTKSPYVAAYFATEQEFEEDGTIWIVHAPTIRDAMKRRHKVDGLLPDEEMRRLLFAADAPPILWITERSTLTSRMVAQQGLFSFCAQVLADHAEVLRSVVEPDHDKHVYSRITIPARLKREFLKRLTAVNITANVLFPGVDGLGRSIAEFVRVSAYAEARSRHSGGK